MFPWGNKGLELPSLPSCQHPSLVAFLTMHHTSSSGSVKLSYLFHVDYQARFLSCNICTLDFFLHKHNFYFHLFIILVSAPHSSLIASFWVLIHLPHLLHHISMKPASCHLCLCAHHCQQGDPALSQGVSCDKSPEAEFHREPTWTDSYSHLSSASTRETLRCVLQKLRCIISVVFSN